MNSKHYQSKRISLLLAGVLIFLSGCGAGGDGAAVNETTGAKGRYVENEVTLPDAIKDKAIVQIAEWDGRLRILLSGEEVGAAAGETTFQEWEYDGTEFVEVTEAWLRQLSAPGRQYLSAKILRNKDERETSYFYALYKEGEEDYKGHLWKVSGDSLTEITPEKWQERNDYGFYDYPMDIALADGTLVGNIYGTLDFYQAEDGKLIRQTPLTGQYLETVATWGGQYYLMESTDGQTVTSVNAFAAKDDSEAGRIPFSQEAISFNFISIIEDGTILLGNGDGFFRCRQGENSFEKLMAGVDTSLGRIDIWCQAVTALPDGSFYAAYMNESQAGILMRYVYDPEAVNEVTETLALYSVEESFLLQQAAVLFHKEHPEVMIEVETEVSFDDKFQGNVDYRQIYQELNTKLIAGEAADILVMDNLNQDALIEKGLLVDINDIVVPLEQDGQLLENITGSYLREDGKRYMVPLGFSMVLAVGREIDIAQMADMPALAGTLSSEQESLMGPLTPDELLDRFFPYFCRDLIQNNELNQEVLKTNLEYLKIIGENSGILSGRSDMERPSNIFDIASTARLVLEENTGFNDAMLPIAAATLVNGSYTAFDNTFYPKLEIGINAASEHVETAKEFIAFALSRQIQDHDYYQGYPVHADSLEFQSQADRSMAEAYTTIAVGDGGEQEFAIGQYGEQDAGKLLEACHSVNRIAGIDETVRDKILASLPAYLDGTIQLEEAAQAITGELRMYLQE